MIDPVSKACYLVSHKIFSTFHNDMLLDTYQEEDNPGLKAWYRQKTPNGCTDEEVCILMDQVMREV